MSIDTQIGLLLGLTLVCVGGLFAMVVMWWMDVRTEGHTPPGHGFDEPTIIPPSEPAWDMPDFVPDEWVSEAA